MIYIILIFLLSIFISIISYEGIIRSKANKKLAARIEILDLIMDEMESENKKENDKRN